MFGSQRSRSEKSARSRSLKLARRRAGAMVTSSMLALGVAASTLPFRSGLARVWVRVSDEGARTARSFRH
jgi:hypothetical protein